MFVFWHELCSLTGMPGTPDFLAQFAEAMRKGGIARSEVERYAEYWIGLPPETRNLPCPFCFVQGKTGMLIDLLPDVSRHIFICKTCTSEIIAR